jgi:hypothetical protein
MLKLPIGLSKSYRTGVLGLAEMPEDPATDDRGEVHFLGEAVTMLLVSQKIDGERQATPGQHGDQTLLPQRTDQPIERHRRNMADHGRTAPY